MAIQKTAAIVLRRQDVRETSLALTFFTRDFGKIKGLLRGVRGSRAESWGLGALEILSCDDIVFYEPKKSDVSTVSQCDLKEFFGHIRGSLDRLAYAAYIAELLDSVTVLYDPNKDAFDLLLYSLRLMDGQSSPKRVARIFEIKLLHLLGLMPTLEFCATCGSKIGESAKFSVRHGGLICKNCLNSDPSARPMMAGTIKFIEYIRKSPFEKLERVKVAEAVGKELEIALRNFLDYHIERRLKTLDFLKEIEK
ncbi:MAG: DNA repair protein RecO [Candidatus Omnitrophica bacterium]|nr:DNA repair protein RecO [Candidatus Omnitrophota bacterium]